MKTTQITIPFKNVAQFPDPQEKGHDKYYANVNVKDIPLDLNLEFNPREQDLDSKVAKEITSGLLEDSDVFHLLNRGLTILSPKVEIDNRRHCLVLDNPTLIDGGHTYGIIKKFVVPTLQLEKKPGFTNAFVELKILTNIKPDLAIDLAQSLNTSMQVKDYSLADLEGSFDWIKAEIKNTRFADKISYKENEIGEIDIRRVVAIMTLFHENFIADQPIIAYSSTQKCLDLYRDPEGHKGYQKLRPVLIDILEFYDFAQLNFEKIYKQTGGLSMFNAHYEKKKDSVRLGRLTEVKQVENGYVLPFIGETCHYKYPLGWVFPLVGAHRMLLSYKNTAKWKMPPTEYFMKYGKGLVSLLLSASKDLGRSPNQVGKNRMVYQSLSENVQNQYTKLLGIDMDQMVHV